MNTQCATTTIRHEVTVAGGIFAPGHLGELTQYLPFELVDDALAQTRTVQRRLRDLPSRAGVCFVLAPGMFPRLCYLRVCGKLTAGLAGLGLRCPSEKALRDLRRRIGPAPLKALFEVVAGPCEAKRRDAPLGAPLMVILRGDRISGARRTAPRLLQARSPGCVTAGTARRRVRGNERGGSGPRRCAPALEAAGQAAAPRRRDSPATTAAVGAALSTVRAPFGGPRAPAGSPAGPDGLARRRRALESLW